MNLRGSGFVYVNDNGNEYLQLSNAFVYQCPQCYNAVICEVDAARGYLGTYVMFNPLEELSSWGTVKTVYPDEVGYNSSIADDYYFKWCIWETF